MSKHFKTDGETFSSSSLKIIENKSKEKKKEKAKFSCKRPCTYSIEAAFRCAKERLKGCLEEEKRMGERKPLAIATIYDNVL